MTDDLRWNRALATTSRAVAAADGPPAIADAIEALLLDWVGEYARCLFVDGDTVWATDGAELPRELAHVGSATGTGRALLLPRIAAWPVGRHAVLLVGRRAEDLDAVATARLAAVSELLAPLLEHVALREELPEAPDDPDGAAGPFRREALEARAGADQRAALLDDRAPWAGCVYRALVAVAAVAVVLGWCVPMGDWCEGPAVVRLVGRRELTAPVAGAIAEVGVVPGEAVVAGQPLVWLDAPGPAADLARVRLAFDQELRNLLRDPADPAARQAVAALRAERVGAEAALDAATLRAPVDAVVADVRVRVGAAVGPGDVLVSLATGDAGAELVALMPGDARPRIRPGMPLRLAVDGYPDAPATVVVDRVDEDVVGSAEAARLLGLAASDGIGVDGPVTLVRAALPDAFGPYRFHDGLRGRASVRVRSTPVLVALIPALERR
ncbi:MAG: HlyD family efflux transporter periplasmic adaptor subunit [Myxococcota bacterium]